jgi:bifunctional DNA-binding transcriptional regulator/antitoxin component of YhaV-PrlF toxin-antitoxin module
MEAAKPLWPIVLQWRPRSDSIRFIRNRIPNRSNSMPKATNEGQVRIPERFIRALGIVPGTEVDFEQQGDVLLLRIAGPRKISRPEDGPNILAYDGPTVTLDEIDEAVREGALKSQ